MQVQTVKPESVRPMYWVESAHGVTLDVVNNLPGARRSAGAGQFNHTYCRIYCVDKGVKTYIR